MYKVSSNLNSAYGGGPEPERKNNGPVRDFIKDSCSGMNDCFHVMR